jgi:hypothetical protein
MWNSEMNGWWHVKQEQPEGVIVKSDMLKGAKNGMKDSTTSDYEIPLTSGGGWWTTTSRWTGWPEVTVDDSTPLAGIDTDAVSFIVKNVRSHSTLKSPGKESW